jgi:hypothetical protein
MKVCDKFPVLGSYLTSFLSYKSVAHNYGCSLLVILIKFIQKLFLV